MRVPGGRKNIQGFGGNAAGRDWSLESACDKHNLIYARQVFAKFEGKTGTIKIRYSFITQSCMVILLIFNVMNSAVYVMKNRNLSQTRDRRHASVCAPPIKRPRPKMAIHVNYYRLSNFQAVFWCGHGGFHARFIYEEFQSRKNSKWLLVFVMWKPQIFTCSSCSTGLQFLKLDRPSINERELPTSASTTSAWRGGQRETGASETSN